MSFTYRLIYNDKSKTSGEPDAIEYKIYSATTDMDRKLIVVVKGYMEQMSDDDMKQAFAKGIREQYLAEYATKMEQ